LFRNFERICETYNEKFVKYASYMNFINDLENDERNRDRRFGSTYFDLIENEVTEDEKKSQSSLTPTLKLAKI